MCKKGIKKLIVTPLSSLDDKVNDALPLEIISRRKSTIKIK